VDSDSAPPRAVHSGLSLPPPESRLLPFKKFIAKSYNDVFSLKVKVKE
jgi:hypothetical protein